MSDAWELLEQAFIEDHRRLSRGYRDIMEAIEDDNFPAARAIAENLDRAAGPHIEFEERYLYPEVRRSRGECYAARLLSEHTDALETLVDLQQCDSLPSDTQKQHWLNGMRRGLDHAASCGTLLSHLQTFDPQRQRTLLTRLDELRLRGKKWSELHPVHEKR